MELKHFPAKHTHNTQHHQKMFQHNEIWVPTQKYEDRIRQILQKFRSSEKFGLVYHNFVYKGYECLLVRGFALNRRWCSIIRVGGKQKNLTLPRMQYTPMVAGVDFDFSEGDDRIVGFHQEHLVCNRDLPGLKHVQDVDYMAMKTRQFIDICSRHV